MAIDEPAIRKVDAPDHELEAFLAGGPSVDQMMEHLAGRMGMPAKIGFSFGANAMAAAILVLASRVAALEQRRDERG